MSINYPTLSHFRHFSSLFTDFRSTTVENVRQINPFYAKQSQFYAFFARKRRFHQKTNPIQTQLKPIQSQFNPKQTQFKPIQTQSKPILPTPQSRMDKIAFKIYPFGINCPIVYMIFGIRL